MYRFTVAILVSYAVVVLASPNVTSQVTALDLRSEILTPPVLFENLAPPAHEIRIRGKIDQNGEGRGVLTLDPNVPTFNEFGTGTISNSDKQQVSLDVKIQFVREGWVTIEAGPPPEKWYLYRITSDKMETSVTLAAPADESDADKLPDGDKIETSADLPAPNETHLSGRLIIHDQNGKVKFVIGMSNPFPPDTLPLP